VQVLWFDEFRNLPEIIRHDASDASVILNEDEDAV
jgi:hypothetical protein